MENIILIIVIIIVVVAALVYGKNKPQKKKMSIIELLNLISKGVVDEYKQEILDFLSPYIDKLAIKEKQLIYKDDYGDYIFDDWFNEQERFIRKKMRLLLYNIAEKAKNKLHNKVSLNAYSDSYRNDKYEYLEEDIISEIKSIMDKLIDKHNLKQIKEGSLFEYNIDDPYLFEKSVEENFELCGWESQGTPKSGDQGADVIAQLNGVKIVVQCKLYSKPVGNKAVQEVISAKQFFNGDLAVVISNASFTKSAKQLADSSDVILLHYSNLSEFIERLEV